MAITSYQELTTTVRNWDISYLKLRDGHQLRWAYWRVEISPQYGYVLIMPGRIEFIEKYTEVAHEWAMRGYQAVCVDWRGQGGSSRMLPDAHKSHVDTFDTYLKDLQEFWKRVWLPEVKNDHTIIHAHSTGANLALRFLSNGRKKIKGAEILILSAPLVQLNYGVGLPRFISALVVKFMGMLKPTNYALGQGPHIQSQRPFDENKLTSDENRYRVWQDLQEDNPELATGGATWGWVKSAQISCIKVRRNLKNLRIPTLALVTPNDQVVDGKAQERFEGVATVIPFAESQHEIFMEREPIRTYAWNVVDDFLLKLHKREIQGKS